MLLKNYLKRMLQGGPMTDSILAKIKKKDNVTLDGINPAFENYFSTFPPNILERITITSGSDGKHKKGSAHYSGNALDLRLNSYHEGRQNLEDDEVYKYLKSDTENQNKYGVYLYDNLNHGSAPHIHIYAGGKRQSATVPTSTAKNTINPSSNGKATIENYDYNGLKPLDYVHVEGQISPNDFNVLTSTMTPQDTQSEKKEDIIKEALEYKIAQKSQVLKLLQQTDVPTVEYGNLTPLQLAKRGGIIK